MKYLVAWVLGIPGFLIVLLVSVQSRPLTPQSTITRGIYAMEDSDIGLSYFLLGLGVGRRRRDDIRAKIRSRNSRLLTGQGPGNAEKAKAHRPGITPIRRSSRSIAASKPFATKVNICQSAVDARHEGLSAGSGGRLRVPSTEDPRRRGAVRSRTNVFWREQRLAWCRDDRSALPRVGTIQHSYIWTGNRYSVVADPPRRASRT